MGAMKFLHVLLAIGTLAVTSTAFGQYNYRYYGGPSFVQYRASTPLQGVYYGAAAMAQAAGQRNLMNSQAALNALEAQRMATENRELRAQAYFRMREANEEYRQRHARPRPTREQLTRLAEMATPEPPSPSELDSHTGRIRWPLVLQDDLFAAHRQRIEEIFAQRAEGEMGWRDVRQLDAVTDAFLAQLRDHIDYFPPMDYVAAKRFVESLHYTGRQPPEQQ